MPNVSGNLKTIFKGGVSGDKRILNNDVKSRLQHLRTNNTNGKNSDEESTNPPIVIREALVDYIEKVEEEEKLDNLLDQSRRVVYQCKTVFPFDFFPDRLIIDENKINVILKEFFATESVHSILIKNVKDIQIQTSVLFATLVIVPDVYFGEPVKMEYLKKADAYEVRRLVQGIIVCQKEGIDLTKIDVKSVKDKVRKIGNATTATPS